MNIKTNNTKISLKMIFGCILIVEFVFYVQLFVTLVKSIIS